MAPGEHLLFCFTSCETGLCYGAQTGFEFEILPYHRARVTNGEGSLHLAYLRTRVFTAQRDIGMSCVCVYL